MGLFGNIKKGLAAKRAQKMEEKAAYKEAYASARKSAIKESAKVRAQTIVTKAREDAKYSSPAMAKLARGAKAIRSAQKAIKASRSPAASTIRSNVRKKAAKRPQKIQERQALPTDKPDFLNPFK